MSGTNVPSSLGIFNSGAWYWDNNGNKTWDGTPTDILYSFGGGLALYNKQGKLVGIGLIGNSLTEIRGQDRPIGRALDVQLLHPRLSRLGYGRQPFRRCLAQTRYHCFHQGIVRQSG